MDRHIDRQMQGVQVNEKDRQTSRQTIRQNRLNKIKIHVKADKVKDTDRQTK
jgi:hypothetical protein